MSIILQDQLTLSTKTKEQVEKNTQDIAKNTQDIEDLEEKIAVVYKFKGSVDTYAELPTEDNQTGDVWDVKADDMNYAWTADGEWDQLGPTVDLSGYVPTSRTINNKTLESDITLEPSDIGAQETLVSGTNIKTINGTSVLGSGDIVITTNYSFKDTWTTDSTTNTFLNDVYTDEDAIPGMTYLGELTCSDLPTGLNNAEALVEVMPSATAAEKVIHVVITSGNLSPYRWELTYWVIGNTPHNSGWIAFQPQIISSNKLNSDLVTDANQTNKFVTASEKTTWSGKQDALVSGTNIKTVNNTSLLGEGNITIDSLPSQAGNADKFLTTDGTNALWAAIPLPGDATESIKGVVKLATSEEAVAGSNNTSAMTPAKTDTAIKSKFLYGDTNPSTSTVGFICQFYRNTNNNTEWVCSDVISHTVITSSSFSYSGSGYNNFSYDSTTGVLTSATQLSAYVKSSGTYVSVWGKNFTIVGLYYIPSSLTGNVNIFGTETMQTVSSSQLPKDKWIWVRYDNYGNNSSTNQKMYYIIEEGYSRDSLPDLALWTQVTCSSFLGNGDLGWGGYRNWPAGLKLNVAGCYWVIGEERRTIADYGITYTYNWMQLANQSELNSKQNTLTASTGISIISDVISATAMTGATGSVAGTAGLVPAPAATDNEKFLRGDGTWQEVQSGSQPTYDAATKTIIF